MRKYTDQELASAPKIKIAGKEFAIPMLGPRQNRRIVPYIHRMSRMKADQMTTEDWDALYGIIYTALTRAYPDTKEADFMDWDIGIDEAFACIPVIAQQTSLMKMAKAGEAADDKGEGTAATSIGTTLSQESSPIPEPIGTK
jgi:hypothetical protein